MLNKKSRLFSQQEFDSADRIGKIFISLVQPGKFVLNDRDETYLERLRQVWAIMVEQNTQRDRIKLISEAVQINERSVRDLMRDAQYLFGDILQVDSEFEKALLAERLWILHDKARDDGDYETAGKMLERIIKLKGYDREDGGIKREDLVLPEITFTNNPKALTGSTGEYLEYEEGDILEPEATRLPEIEGTD